MNFHLRNFSQIIIDKIYSNNVQVNLESFNDKSYLKLKSHMVFIQKTSRDKKYYIDFSKGAILKKILCSIIKCQFIQKISGKLY